MKCPVCGGNPKSEISVGFGTRFKKRAEYIRCSKCNYIIDVLDLNKDIWNAHTSSEYFKHLNEEVADYNETESQARETGSGIR